MNKRGESLAPSTIATLTLTIAAFIIAALFLLLFLDLDNLSQREVCHLSVLTRATSPDALERLAPLKCETQKICLSMGGNCEKQFGEGENIAKIMVNSREEIEREIAYEMYDCWSMMGQGKLDIFGGKKSGFATSLDPSRVFGEAKTTCLMCSRIALSKEILENEELMESIDVNTYMETHQVPGSELTYLQTFTDEQVRSYPREMRESLRNDTNVTETDQIAIIFMQILTEATPYEAGTRTATEAGGFVLAAGYGTGALGKLLTMNWLTSALVVGGAAAGVAGVGGLAAFQTYRSQQVAAGYCGELTSVDEDANKGCSVVTPFDYNQKLALKDFCAKFEG